MIIKNKTKTKILIHDTSPTFSIEPLGLIDLDDEICKKSLALKHYFQAGIVEKGSKEELEKFLEKQEVKMLEEIKKQQEYFKKIDEEITKESNLHVEEIEDDSKILVKGTTPWDGKAVSTTDFVAAGTEEIGNQLKKATNLVKDKVEDESVSSVVSEPKEEILNPKVKEVIGYKFFKKKFFINKCNDKVLLEQILKFDNNPTVKKLCEQRLREISTGGLNEI